MNKEEIVQAMEHCTRCLECILEQSGAYGCFFPRSSCENCPHDVIIVHKTKLQGDTRDDKTRTEEQ